MKDGLRAALDTERAATAAHLDALERDLDAMVRASAGANADDEHDPEGATIAFERAQLTALLNGSRERLAELDAALDRIEHGTYGYCRGCGRPIAAERLAARPFATMCVDCAGQVRGRQASRTIAPRPPR
jgi:RNA polymerase-binding protein DksA